MGSHLCDALVALGENVTVLDNLSSGKRQNIRDALKSKKIKFILGDCKNSRDVRKAVSEADVVYHFAANPEVRLSLADPATSFRENIYATHVLLEAIRKSDVNRIVFASTSTVYGDAKVVPTPEDYAPMEPISVYGASKLGSEALITAYCRTYHKTAIVLRLANIVGPRSEHGVISDFVKKLKANSRRLEILGDGHQKKSYLHVEDCISATLTASEITTQGEVLNVGSTDQLEVAGIAEIVTHEMGLDNVCFEFTGGVDGGRGWVGDVKNMLLDTTRLKSKGWKPRHNSVDSVRLAVRELLSK